MDRETQQLLAWYVNGSLVGPDRDRVEDALAADPDSARTLAWERAVRGAMKSDPLFDVAADRGLFQVMQKIHSDAPAAPVSAAPAKKGGASPAMTSRGPGWSGWFGRFRNSFQWTPALALACGVVAVQLAVITQLWPTRGEETYSDVRAVENVPRGTTFIRVVFKPQSTEAQLSLMLRENNAEIVAGPSQLGDYYLLVAPVDAPSVLARLMVNAHVDSAEIVNALPSRP